MADQELQKAVPNLKTDKGTAFSFMVRNHFFAECLIRKFHVYHHLLPNRGTL